MKSHRITALILLTTVCIQEIFCREGMSVVDQAKAMNRARKRRSALEAATNKLKGVETTCSKGILKVEITTESGFTGAIYARGYPNKCRSSGKDSKTTTLEMSSQQCGIKIIEDKKGRHRYEMILYIQFDKWVQQIVDEQIHLQCTIDDPASSSGRGRELRASFKMGVDNDEKSEENVREAKVVSSFIMSPLLPEPSSSSSSVNTNFETTSNPNKIDLITIPSRLQEMVKNRHLYQPEAKVKSNVTSGLFTTEFSVPTSSQHFLPSTLITKKTFTKSRLVTNSRLSFLRSSGVLEDSSEIAESDFSENWRPVDSKELVFAKSLNNGKNSKKQFKNNDAVSGWMDILEGESLEGKAVYDYLEVGDDVTMVIKVRQEPGLDTRVTSCVAHDGSGDNSQDLLDSRGCAIDDAILPPLRVKRLKDSGMKVSYSTFKAFKFPDRDNLHLKCTVLICLGSCSLPICGRTASNGVGRKPKSVPIGSGSFAVIEDEDGGENKKLSRGNSRAAGGKIVDKVEVFNSFEVRASGIEDEEGRPEEFRHKNVEEVDFYKSDDMFCVTPYKMVLSFGILLAIMVAAVLFSIYSCVKGKLRNKSTYARHQPYQPTHPKVNVQHFPAHFPYMDPRRGSPINSPYYRFAH